MKESSGRSQSTGRERLGRPMCDESVSCTEMGWAGVKEEICRRAEDKQSSPQVLARRFTSHDPDNHGRVD